MAEALFGASRGARDVIQVVIDHNVGAGVITDVICYTQAAVVSWK
ncbi:transcriptional regulator [Escherichia coli]|uniref:Transcriptional regulator n=1 Tax=Escherichia coli TaxID=562 RepID=A0A377CKD0_ECOLX|nr:transcriptional regulator [Escherichia coli]